MFYNLMYCRYGALEGHSKPGLAHLYGEDVVQKWRAGLHERPPAMTPGMNSSFSFNTVDAVCISLVPFYLSIHLKRSSVLAWR
jgi:bisphosphoglycerate-dependent phosphoglycerate mutase